MLNNSKEIKSITVKLKGTEQFHYHYCSDFGTNESFPSSLLLFNKDEDLVGILNLIEIQYLVINY